MPGPISFGSVHPTSRVRMSFQLLHQLGCHNCGVVDSWQNCHPQRVQCVCLVLTGFATRCHQTPRARTKALQHLRTFPQTNIVDFVEIIYQKVGFRRCNARATLRVFSPTKSGTQPEFVRHSLEKNQGTSDSLPTDSVAAWLLLLMCGSPRANFLPGTHRFIRNHHNEKCGVACGRSWEGDFYVVPLCRRSGVDERTTFPGKRTLGKLGGLHPHGQGTAPCHCGDDDHALGWKGQRHVPKQSVSANNLWREQASTFLLGELAESPSAGGRSGANQPLGGQQKATLKLEQQSCARKCG